ncbi:hypothetical protein [Variovorax sp. 350MFTsu5.1]|uniref:hypothetical protein n=1 Tax=Variovorax sp. 350MFTsu5.1 TaxID=3158365 RepID=UPI003AAFE433
MTATTDNFFDSINGALTPEQALQALSLEEKGDIGGKPDDGGAPATTTATDDKPGAAEPTKGNEQTDETKGKADGAQPIPEDQQTADNTVVLARDGKHTIDFSHPDQARQQRDT